MMHPATAMSDFPLCQHYAVGLPETLGRAFVPSVEVEKVLQEALGAAQAALPQVDLDAAAFLRYVAPRARATDAKTLAGFHAADLFLASASARGNAEALTELNRRLLAVVGPAVSRLRPSDSFVDEVQQLLRQKLLVAGEGGLPKILDYLGKGSLTHWLRAAALRVALNLLEAQRGAYATSQDDEGLDRVPSASPDPEVALLKQRYGPAFKAALEDALAGLTVRERNFLRLYFVNGLTVEQIGRMEGTHKSTVSRWLTRAREALLVDVRARLKERLKLSASELDSLLGVLQSQLEVSLLRVLQ